MGGAVGLKGTDGAAMLAKARALGAEPHAQRRATTAFMRLVGLRGRFELVTCPGSMGEIAARAAGLAPLVLPMAPREASTAETRASLRWSYGVPASS